MKAWGWSTYIGTNTDKHKWDVRRKRGGQSLQKERESLRKVKMYEYTGRKGLLVHIHSFLIMYTVHCIVP